MMGYVLVLIRLFTGFNTIAVAHLCACLLFYVCSVDASFGIGRKNTSIF